MYVFFARCFPAYTKRGLNHQASKCYIGHSAVSFVGHKIIQGKLQTRQELIEKIAKASLPEYIKQVRSFLGLCDYYRKFVPQCADISAPLVNLTKKGQSKTS